MSEIPPIIRSFRPDEARPRLSWAGAFFGIWRLTWKSQVALRRLPGQLATLLVLPVLIYITMVGPRRYVYLGNPTRDLNSLARRMSRDHIPLEPKTRLDLEQILAAANQQSQTAWHEISGETAEARRQRLDNLIDGWDHRILSGARGVLDNRQYEAFQTFQQNNRNKAFQELTQISHPWDASEQFHHWLIGFYFFIILPLTCVRLCGPLIRDELQADTLGFLITRPLGRARLLIVKYACQAAWLEMALLLETLLCFAAGAARHAPGLGAMLPLVLGVQILVIPAWSGLGLLLGQLTARYMAVALLYGLVVELGIGHIPTNINTLAVTRHVETLLSNNAALQSSLSLPGGHAAAAITALLIAPVVFVSLSALLFRIIEYHHAAEMQK